MPILIGSAAVSPQGTMGLALRGTCRAHLIVSRSISVDPRQGLGPFIGGKLPDLCRYEVLRNMRHDL